MTFCAPTDSKVIRVVLLRIQYIHSPSMHLHLPPFKSHLPTSPINTTHALLPSSPYFPLIISFLLQSPMESQCRPNVDGVHNGVESHVKVVEKPRSVGTSSEFVLRILGLLLTLIAAVVAGVDKQTKIIPLTLIKTLPSLHVPVTAKWSDMSAFVYLVVSNAIACSYAAISLVLVTMLGRRGKGGRVLAVIVLDLHMVGLLFSANGAATAVGVLGQYGNSHVEWKKVCNVFDSFCHHLVASLALSFLGSLSFLGLVLLAILNLHKKSSTK